MGRLHRSEVWGLWVWGTQILDGMISNLSSQAPCSTAKPDRRQTTPHSPKHPNVPPFLPLSCPPFTLIL